ncbi:hypothetical protein BGX34_001025, partial [Mortierella sp. NVP85]
YRETHRDIFPKKIYYFGTRKEQKEYWDKYSDGHENHGGVTHDGSSNSTETGSSQLVQSNAPFKRGNSSSSVSKQSRMTELKAIKQGQEDLKKEVQNSHEQIRALQEQLTELTDTLNRVLMLNDPNRQK